ncbi:hypothetical protein Ahy_A04g018127 [Arachis hypogaea]|uniref:Disease resistance protein n=1 Tax=Arachis hypogaea TaxID=3818 RepID=A0A445DCX9_ARAHY|nr:hypothetical protein Ahy_A04g018127 [Arachis hypogaea]
MMTAPQNANGSDTPPASFNSQTSSFSRVDVSGDLAAAGLRRRGVEAAASSAVLTFFLRGCMSMLLKKLEHLNLSNCCKLRQTTDLSGVPNLKTFHLGQCKELNYIHPSLAHHKSLVELDLWGCESLER